MVYTKIKRVKFKTLKRITLKNTTNIEAWIVQKANWRRTEIHKSNETFLFPYDLGYVNGTWRSSMLIVSKIFGGSLL